MTSSKNTDPVIFIIIWCACIQVRYDDELNSKTAAAPQWRWENSILHFLQMRCLKQACLNLNKHTNQLSGWQRLMEIRLSLVPIIKFSVLIKKTPLSKCEPHEFFNFSGFLPHAFKQKNTSGFMIFFEEFSPLETTKCVTNHTTLCGALPPLIYIFKEAGGLCSAAEELKNRISPNLKRQTRATSMHVQPIAATLLWATAAETADLGNWAVGLCGHLFEKKKV